MDTTGTTDQQAARELFKEINTNSFRRATATRASKRIKLMLQNDDSATSSATESDYSFPESFKPSLVVRLKIGHGSIQQLLSASDADASRSAATVDSSGLNSSALVSRSTKTSRSTKPGDSTGPARSGPVKYHQNVQAKNKNQPFGQPPAWADKRQQLCETLPWYRAYQSGAYTSNGKAKGFMSDKEATFRDVFNDEIMIVSCGGGRENDGNGNTVRKTDQDTSRIAAALEMSKGEPIGLIAGCGNANSPSRLPHTYNVLDWFHVTDVWCERQHTLKVWMVRLEKINLAEKSWWASKTSEPLPQIRDLDQFKANVQECEYCKNPSKEIYDAGWTCLETNCHEFFKFAGRGCENDEDLAYNEQFLNERTRHTGPTTSIIPPLLTDDDLRAMDAFGVEKECKQGIVCPECRCCTRRVEWRQWSCENSACDFTYRTSQSPVPIDEATAFSQAPKPDIIARTISVVQKVMKPYVIHEYNLPDEDGKSIGFVRHFKSCGIINKQPDGPNKLFYEMQERDFGLKRNPSRLKDSSGEVLTAHWAANWGAPYKFGVSVLSKGFDEAPVVILKALQRLTWAGEQAVTANLEPFHPFNELLSIGYFEDSHIGYHDDGEKELGPTVATLSLGASATMSFRPKKKNAVGERAVKGRKSKGEGKKEEGNKKCVLRFTINHGDLVVMHGREIQKLYEHKVDPQGKLRFALTCRYIDPDTITDPQEHQAALVKGKLPAECDRHVYDGDVNASDIAVDESKPADDLLAGVMRLLAGYHTGSIGAAEMQRARQMMDEALSTTT